MTRPWLTALAMAAILLSSCGNNQSGSPANEKVANKEQTFLPPKVVRIADLPDSLKPKSIFLDKMPKPLTVAIPAKEGGFYTRKYPNGDTRKFMLAPPEKKMLPVLTDDKGQPIKDAKGKTFIMGMGGKSDFTNFTSDDGLGVSAIWCSMMDKAGNLWFGTQGGGLSRYDGKSFTNYNISQGLSSNGIDEIFEDNAGNIWIFTAEGLTKFDGKAFNSFAIGLEEDLSKEVQSVFQDRQGNMWFGTSEGALRYDSKTFTLLTTKNGLPSDKVNYIFQDKKGNLWFCTVGGLSKYDGKTFTNYTTADGLPANLIVCMAESKDGLLWFGTNHGLSRYDGKTFTNFHMAQGLPNDNIRAISTDKSGNIWFGTNHGLSKYDGKTFTSFATEQGLAANNIESITEDRAGNLWFCTNDGISKFTGGAFTSFTTTQGLPDNIVWNINLDKQGNYWFCTANGLSRYDGKSFTNFNESQGMAYRAIYSGIQDKFGNLWFASLAKNTGGLNKYDGMSFTTFTTEQGLIGNYVLCSLIDKDGNLWFGSGDGLSKYDSKSFTSYKSAQGLINDGITALCQDKDGKLWIGTFSYGVTRFDGQTFTNFTIAQGLANNGINSIRNDKSGNIWICTQAGVSRLSAEELDKLKQADVSPDKAPVVKFDNLTMSQGLADDQATEVLPDKKGNIFIGTNLGFTVIPEDASSLPFSQVRSRLEYYNRPAGYPIRDVNTNAMYCDSQGIIWAGTGTGLVRFDYSAVQKDSAKPLLAIQKIRVTGESICWFDLQSKGRLVNAADSAKAMFQESMAYGKMIAQADRDSIIKKFAGVQLDSITPFYLLPQGLELPYSRNEINIDFNAIETSKPNQIEYQYMLQGYQKDWGPVTKATTATFGNMFEGSYTFLLRARKMNGDWSEPLTYSFKVLPPWYRTWWAYVLCILFIAVIVRAYVAYRSRNLRRANQVLEEKVTHRTSQLNKSLEDLKSTQAQLIQSEKMASLGELTAGIAHEIQNPLNFVNNFSEVNKELISEMREEIAKKNFDEVDQIAKDVQDNEEKINHHGRRADAIVKGMLQHSRSGTGVKEPTNINALADEYLRLAYHGIKAKDNSFNATMKTDLDNSVGKINIVPQDIGRVLLNLYNNAFYAVGEKLKAERLKQNAGYDPVVAVQTKKSGNQLFITVSDNGNGIPKNIVDKIFQPFFTTKPTGSGTGLGLSLSYDIIKAHGGEIKVETKVDEGNPDNFGKGEGTTFIIQLPVV